VAALATYALAGMKEHDSTKLPFGASYHKSPAGMSLNYLRAEWNADGLTHLQYQVAAFKGHVTLNDMLIVTGGQTIYKRSDHKKLGMDFSYTDLTQAKGFFDNIYFPTPIKPFDEATSEIMWLVSYMENGQKKDVVVVWTLKGNTIDWKPVKQ
jgi:hypothetical protein